MFARLLTARVLIGCLFCSSRRFVATVFSRLPRETGLTFFFTVSKPVPPSQTILRARPLAKVLKLSSYGLRCETCFRPRSKTVELRRCSACKLACYDTEECQKAGWNDGHRLLCDFMVMLQQVGLHPLSYFRFCSGALVRHLQQKLMRCEPCRSGIGAERGSSTTSCLF